MLDVADPVGSGVAEEDAGPDAVAEASRDAVSRPLVEAVSKLLDVSRAVARMEPVPDPLPLGGGEGDKHIVAVSQLAVGDGDTSIDAVSQLALGDGVPRADADCESVFVTAADELLDAEKGDDAEGESDGAEAVALRDCVALELPQDDALPRPLVVMSPVAVCVAATDADAADAEPLVDARADAEFELLNVTLSETAALDDALVDDVAWPVAADECDVVALAATLMLVPLDIEGDADTTVEALGRADTDVLPVAVGDCVTAPDAEVEPEIEPVALGVPDAEDDGDTEAE